jgi:hypothetical protein
MRTGFVRPVGDMAIRKVMNICADRAVGRVYGSFKELESGAHQHIMVRGYTGKVAVTRKSDGSRRNERRASICFRPFADAAEQASMR